MGEVLKAGQASIWLQPNGANSKPQYLGCHELGDISEPFGDVTLLYCPDPASAGKWKVVGSYQSQPGQPTTSITTDVNKVADLLETLICPSTLIIHKVTCGRRDVFTNYDRSFVLRNVTVTSRGLQKLAARSPDAEDRSTQTFDLTMEEVIRIYGMMMARQDAFGGLSDVMGLTFCDAPKCADACGVASAGCQYGVAVTKVTPGSTGFPEVFVTTDGGNTWTGTTADPFGPGEDISAVVCFQMSRNITRILVARGTTDPAAHAEVAYSDDDGDTWNNVSLPGANAGFVVSGNGLFALDYAHIWAVSNLGYIFFSDDGGVTWDTQSAATLTSNPLNAIRFIDSDNGYVCGDSNIIGHTADAGVTWTLLTGPAAKAAVDALALSVVDTQKAWVGYADGSLYYTDDYGVTWNARTIPISLTSITCIAFISSVVGFLVGNDSGGDGHMLRSFDGGYTWEEIVAPANDGFNFVWPCGPNAAFVAGDEESGTGFIAKVFA